MLATTLMIGYLSMMEVHWMGGALRMMGRSVDPARINGPVADLHFWRKSSPEWKSADDLCLKHQDDNPKVNSMSMCFLLPLRS